MLGVSLHTHQSTSSARCRRTHLTRITCQQSFDAQRSLRQRDILRQFYTSAPHPQDMLTIIRDAQADLDTATSLHLLSHTADLALKKELAGNIKQQQQLCLTILRTLEDQLTSKSLLPVHLANLLWGLSSIPGIACQQTDQLLISVAQQELEADRVASYNTRELSSLIFACGKLVRQHTTASSSSDEICLYTLQLLQELNKRIDEQPYIKSSFAPSDMADLVDSSTKLNTLSVVFSKDQQCAYSKAVAKLLDLIGHEMRRQLANRHPLRSPFGATDLIRFLQGYALYYYNNKHNPSSTSSSSNSLTLSSEVASLLDSISSFITRRITSDHINAVSSPEDLAAILQSYVDINHISLGTVELLNAVGLQLRKAALVVDTHHNHYEETGERSRGAPAAHRQFSLRAVGSVLKSHALLGYLPSSVSLQLLEPVIVKELSHASVDDVECLMEGYAAIGTTPGTSVQLLIDAKLS